MRLQELEADFTKLANPTYAEDWKRFFKTGPGQYGYGDQFLGISVPVSRQLAKRYRELPVRDAVSLLRSPAHEKRLVALFLFIHRFQKGTPEDQKQIFDLYITHISQVNNWDLVDASAEHIIGAFLEDKPKALLLELAESDSVWKRRIAMVATFRHIKKSQFEWPLRLAEKLLKDPHDLIRKAVGWMLREIGKRDRAVLERFLKTYASVMPRTMLRYAIEHFDADQRARYLSA